MIPESDWIWQGHPGHFCGARDCLFRLATVIGDVIVSTVGDYYAPLGTEGKMQRTEIGFSGDPARPAYYETYVFKLAPPNATRTCESCRDVADWSEIEGVRCSTALEAQAQHLTMCRKWAALDGKAV